MKPSTPHFSDQQQILREYSASRQLNSKFGIEEQYKYLLIWCKMTKASGMIKNQALENFKLLHYREWLESYMETDNLPDAGWRYGNE